MKEIENYLPKNPGMTLIEVVIAIGFFGLLGSALIMIVGQTKSVTVSSQLRNQASRYAEEAMEIVRRTRDENKDDWYNFLEMTCNRTNKFADGQCYHLVSGNLESVGTDCQFENEDCSQDIPNTQFKRYIYLYNDSSISDYRTSKMKVTVIVAWTEKGREEKIRQESFLTGW